MGSNSLVAPPRRAPNLIIRYVTVRYARCVACTPCYVAAPKNYRPTSTCLKIILAGAFDVEARSAVSLGLLDVEGRSADSSVFFCVFAQSSPSVGIFGQRTGRWYFLQSSPSTGILTNGLDRAFWGGLRIKIITNRILSFWACQKTQSRIGFKKKAARTDGRTDAQK